MLTLCFCESIYLLNQYKKEYVNCIILFVCITCFITTSFYLSNTNKREDFLQVNNKKDINFMATGDEYLPIGTDISLLEDNYKIENGQIEVLSYEKIGTEVYLDVFVTEDTLMTIPLLYYKNYISISDIEIPLDKNDNNVIQIQIPKGNHSIKVYFKPPIHWKISYIISILSFFILILFLLYNNLPLNTKKIIREQLK